jgi:RNA polymerase sigma-70 factor (ECF subfamily)
MLRRFAYGLAGTSEQADDLVQEAFARLLSSGKENEAYIDRWLFRTIRNVYIDQYRSQATANRYREELEQTVSHATAGDGQMESLLTLEEVGSAISALSVEQRSVLLLVGAEGFTYQETALMLDLPIGTVTSRLARARKQLMKMASSPEQSANPRGGVEPGDDDENRTRQNYGSI